MAIGLIVAVAIGVCVSAIAKAIDYEQGMRELVREVKVLRKKHGLLQPVGDEPAAARNALIQIALENIRKAESVGTVTDLGRNGASELLARGLTKIYRILAVVDDVDLTLRLGDTVGPL